MSHSPDEEFLASFDIHRQPDDTTCGPTCLHAVYRYYGDQASLESILAEVPTLEGGGTLGVLLATHALKRGYSATILTCNLQVFDPTWFPVEDPAALRAKLLARAAAVTEPRVKEGCHAYVEYLDNGGKLELVDINSALLRKHLKRGVPILTGLSATFLYRDAREIAATCVADDLAGEPVGHFVVLTGYRPDAREVLVSDPLYPNALATEHTYPVAIERVIGAIYLGVLTYDANLMLLEPARRGGK